jgi:hypothetical protein
VVEKCEGEIGVRGVAAMLQNVAGVAPYVVEGSGRRGDWALDAAGAKRPRHDDPQVVVPLRYTIFG